MHGDRPRQQSFLLGQLALRHQPQQSTRDFGGPSLGIPSRKTL